LESTDIQLWESPESPAPTEPLHRRAEVLRRAQSGAGGSSGGRLPRSTFVNNLPARYSLRKLRDRRSPPVQHGQSPAAPPPRLIAAPKRWEYSADKKGLCSIAASKKQGGCLNAAQKRGCLRTATDKKGGAYRAGRLSCGRCFVRVLRAARTAQDRRDVTLWAVRSPMGGRQSGDRPLIRITQPRGLLLTGAATPSRGKMHRRERATREGDDGETR
jgi:hypothetical protein